MFVLTSTYNAHLLAIVKAKDAQLADLQDQVRFLRSMIQPKNSRALVIAAEADAILEGRQDQIEDPRAAQIESEAAKLMSGNY